MKCQALYCFIKKVQIPFATNLTGTLRAEKGKCLKILNTLHHTFCLNLFFMHLFHKILGGMANNIADQTASSDLDL